ncbi:MAG: type II secretion system protein GspG, partial [Myxococcales bacterium]
MSSFNRFRKLASSDRTRRGMRRHERGMTLIEIMVALTILGLVVAAVGVAVIPQLQYAKIDTTRSMIGTIESGLKLYYTRHGKYPDTGSGLGVLVQEKFLDKQPKDGWGNDFVYLNE